MPLPATYKGRSYESFTQLYESSGDSPRVSIETFRSRIWAAWKKGSLTERRLEDALTLSKDPYRKAYGNRVTWIEVNGKRRDLGRIYAAMSEKRRVVPYTMFRSRIRNLERRLESLTRAFGPVAVLIDALLVEAATDDNAAWRRGWGASRISPLVYGEVLYPTYCAFVHAMEREDDLSVIRNRLKRGVSPDNALEPRVSRSGGLIYLIAQKSTGLEYIGLTSSSLEKDGLITSGTPTRVRHKGFTKQFGRLVRRTFDVRFLRMASRRKTNCASEKVTTSRVSERYGRTDLTAIEVERQEAGSRSPVFSMGRSFSPSGIATKALANDMTRPRGRLPG